MRCFGGPFGSILLNLKCTYPSNPGILFLWNSPGERVADVAFSSSLGNEDQSGMIVIMKQIGGGGLSVYQHGSDEV